MSRDMQAEATLALERIKELTTVARELLQDLKNIAVVSTAPLSQPPTPVTRPRGCGDSQDTEEVPESKSPGSDSSEKQLSLIAPARVTPSSLRAPAAVYTISERSFNAFEATVTKLINLSEAAQQQYTTFVEHLPKREVGSPPENNHVPKRSASVVRFAAKRRISTGAADIDETVSDGESEALDGPIATTPPVRGASLRARVAPQPLQRESVEAQSNAYPTFGGLFAGEGAVDGDIARAYSPVASFRVVPGSNAALARTSSVVSVFSIGGEEDSASPFSPPALAGPGGVRHEALNLDFVRQQALSPGVPTSGTASPSYSPRRTSDVPEFVLTPQARDGSPLLDATTTEAMLADLALRFPKLVPPRQNATGVTRTLSLINEISSMTFNAVELAVEWFEQREENPPQHDIPDEQQDTMPPRRTQSAASQEAFHRAASTASLGTAASHGSMASLRAALHSAAVNPNESRAQSPAFEATCAPGNSHPGITLMWKAFICCSLTVLLQYRFVQEFAFDLNKLVAFLDAVFWLHTTRDGYHGALKTITALHTAHTCLAQSHVAKYLGDLDLFGTLLAVLTMDIGHPGVTNDFLVRTNHPLANLFGVTAPTESLAVALAMTLLRDPRLNFVGRSWLAAPPRASLEGHRTNEVVLKDLLSQLILATNPPAHMQVMTGLSAIFAADKQLTAHNLSRAATDQRRRSGTSIMRATSFESMGSAEAGGRVSPNVDSNHEGDWLSTIKEADVPVVLQAIVRICDASYAVHEPGVFLEWVDSQIVECRRQQKAEQLAGITMTQGPRSEGNPLFYHQRVLQLVIAPLLEALPIVPHGWRRCVKSNIKACQQTAIQDLPSLLPALKDTPESVLAWEDNSLLIASSLKELLPSVTFCLRTPTVVETVAHKTVEAHGSGVKAAEALQRGPRLAPLQRSASPQMIDADIGAPTMIAVLRLMQKHVVQIIAQIASGRTSLANDTFGAELLHLVAQTQPAYLGDAINKVRVDRRETSISVSEYASIADDAIRSAELSGLLDASSVANIALHEKSRMNICLVWLLKIWEGICQISDHRGSTRGQAQPMLDTTTVAPLAPPAVAKDAPASKYFSPYSLGRR